MRTKISVHKGLLSPPPPPPPPQYETIRFSSNPPSLLECVRNVWMAPKFNSEKERKCPITENANMVESDDTNDDYSWPPNTILITSDSMLQHIDENGLCKGKFKVKVCFQV